MYTCLAKLLPLSQKYCGLIKRHYKLYRITALQYNSYPLKIFPFDPIYVTNKWSLTIADHNQNFVCILHTEDY